MNVIAAAAAEWLQALCRGLVPDPSVVTVVPLERNGVLELHIIATTRSARGRLIGTGGRTAALIRDLAFIYAQTQHLTKVHVVVVDPERRMSSDVQQAAIY